MKNVSTILCVSLLCAFAGSARLNAMEAAKASEAEKAPAILRACAKGREKMWADPRFNVAKGTVKDG